MRDTGLSQGGHLPGRLGRMAGFPGYRHISLEGLSQSETATFLRAHLRDRFSSLIAQNVFERTQGRCPIYKSLLETNEF